MFPKRMRKLLSFLAASALVLSLTACGAQTSQTSQSTPASKTSSSAEASPTAPTAKEITLYVAENSDKSMAQGFQAKTGIKVNIVHVATGDLLAKMEAERSNPHWDVTWFDGASSMQSLDNQGFLLKDWTPANTADYTDLGKQLIPADHAYFPTHVTAAAAIAYNTKLVPSDQAPKDWRDLLKPEFKNAIAMNDPSISGPTYPFVAGLLQQMGDSQGKQFFQDLKQNGLKIFPKNPTTLQSLTTGASKAIMIQDTAILASQIKGDPVKLVYPSSGVPMLYGVIAVNPKSANLGAAKEFVDYVLSAAGQKLMLDPKTVGGDAYYLPILQGVKMNSQRPTADVKWLNVDPVKGAQEENGIKKWFHDNITQ